MIKKYLANLYNRTMAQAYNFAAQEIFSSLQAGGSCLDCGASAGAWYQKISDEISFDKSQYFGIEWDQYLAEQARNKGLNVRQRDLNRGLSFNEGKFTCIFGLSVLEHLLNGCHFINESHRTLKRGGNSYSSPLI